jgi:regulatory protein
MPAPPKPRPVTASTLQNAAMHYLAGRVASTAMVRAMLERRAQRRLGIRRLPPDVDALIEGTLARLGQLGLIDDRTFAEVRARSLADRGLPRRSIAQRIQLKGVDRETVECTLGDGIDDLAQARRFAERRRLGPWRSGLETPDLRRKDLAALARAGFAYAVAKAALERRPDPDGPDA